jgi:hypothetical protein
MKRASSLFIPLCIFFVAFTGAAFQAAENCDSLNLKQKAKEALNPYKYDSGKVSRILYATKPQTKELEVPVFIGEKYRMIFNTEALSKNVVISIYNKNKDTPNRTPLFTTKNAAIGQKIHMFEPQQAKFKFYVDYEIPAAADSSGIAECLIFMLGYK